MNNITVVGFVGRDAEMRYTPSGVAVTNINIADSQFVKGEKETVWWRVALWGKAAESAEKNIKKGDSVAVVGEINQTARIWYTQDGEARVSMEINGRSWSFAGKKSDNEGGGYEGEAETSPTHAPVDEDSIPF